jgi:hypothetical protein
MSRSAGWYPDPSDPNGEIYWDGSGWHGRRQKRRPTAEPQLVGRAPQSSGAEPMSATERSANFWRRLSDGGRALIIFGVIAVAALIGTLFARPWESKYQNGCESQVAADGVSPTSPSFEGYVDMCVKSLEDSER